MGKSTSFRPPYGMQGCSAVTRNNFYCPDSPYRVGLQAQANFSAPTFEPAHEARAGKRAALSVNLSQLQLRCSNSITGSQASSSRSELSANSKK